MQKSWKSTRDEVKFFYRVRYVLDMRKENESDDSILKLWVSPAGRPTRSTQSLQQSSSAQSNMCVIFTYTDSQLMAPYHTAEENEIERLRYQIAAQ